MGPPGTFDVAKFYFKICSDLELEQGAARCYCDGDTDVLISGGAICPYDFYPLRTAFPSHVGTPPHDYHYAATCYDPTAEYPATIIPPGLFTFTV
jgi:hypothetical protein